MVRVIKQEDSLHHSLSFFFPVSSPSLCMLTPIWASFITDFSVPFRTSTSSKKDWLCSVHLRQPVI